MLVPQNGYTRIHEYSDVFLPCMYKDACIGEEISEKTGRCKFEYEGFMCAQCASGYWMRPLTFYCNECLFNPILNLVLALVKFLLLFVIFIKLEHVFKDRVKKNSL